MSTSSSFRSTNIPSNTNPSFSEDRWVIQIRRTLEEDLEEEHSNIPVRIFAVPKTLLATDPNSYTPQQVAIGPYHYWRPELYEMERYKIAAAKRILKVINGFDSFRGIVDEFKEGEPRIRACYHKYLDFSGETLAWMMAIDASFLLEFLEVYASKEGKLLTRISSRMSHLVDSAGRKSAHIAILRDILMLENQIPLFLLREMLKFHSEMKEVADDMLLSMLKGLCKELFPFRLPEELPKLLLQDSAHILDFFYRLLMPKAVYIAACEFTEDDDQGQGMGDDQENITSDKSSGVVKTFFDEIWKILSKLNDGPVRFYHLLVQSKPFKLIVKLPWTIVSKFPGLNMLKGPIEHLFLKKDKDEEETEKDDVARPPLIEEITIPSVTTLHKAGVIFVPTDSGICSMNFDEKTYVLSLPKVNLDVNTGVVMRNLVAYEAANASGPMIFTRYTEFMNGIVDTKEDAQLLREKGIILNRLKSDEEVANLWNGMSRSLKLTKVPFMDKVIEDVNKYYSQRWRVKAEKCLKGYVFGSWKILTLLATLVLLGLMALQAFCSVYSCNRMLSVYLTPTGEN